MTDTRAMGSCDVCYGTPGRYPIINKYGSQLYEIACPECGGSGLSEAEFDLRQQRRAAQERYDVAMADMRSRSLNEGSHDV